MKARSSFKKVIILFLFALIFCVNSPALSAPQEKEASMTTPLLLSLLLSHGSGPYKLGLPAEPYLVTHIVFTDIPLLALGVGIIMNQITPEFFSGNTLMITEYVVNAMVLSVLVSAPVIRFFECRKVLRFFAK